MHLRDWNIERGLRFDVLHDINITTYNEKRKNVYQKGRRFGEKIIG